MKRHVWLILLLLGGSGSLLYGSLFHVVIVAEEKEREISIAIPAPPALSERPSEQGKRADDRPAEAEARADDSATPADVDPFRSRSAERTQPNESENPFESASVSSTPPDMRYEKVTEKFFEARAEPECVIVREVTVGGVTRLDSDQLKRTYSGTAPSLCPT
jgi:hypothetical protein